MRARYCSIDIPIITILIINYHCDYLYLEVRCSIKPMSMIKFNRRASLVYMKACMHLKFNNLNTALNSFASSFNAYRPKHIVICDRTFILPWKIFRQTARVQTKKNCDDTMRTSVHLNVFTNCHGLWRWCSRLVQPGYSESHIAIWSMFSIFWDFRDFHDFHDFQYEIFMI